MNYLLSVQGLDGIAIQTETRVQVEPEAVYTLPMSVTVPHESATGGQRIEFVVEAVDDSGYPRRGGKPLQRPAGRLTCSSTTIDTLPWFRHRMVWLVIGIPVLTVLGCALTIFLALTSPDPMVSDPVDRDTESNAARH